MGGQDNITQIAGGINLDSNPLNQPKGTRRFTLNTVEESAEGDKVYLGNEPSNGLVDSYPTGYYEIGKCYMVNNENCVMLHNPSLQLDIIGVLKNDKFTEYVKTDLNFHISKQIDCQFRLRKGKFRTIYFVDGYNNARIVNLDNLLDHNTQLYKNYLDAGGSPSLYTGEKWDVSSFSLFKIYNQYPTFDNVAILEYGNILPGSISFAIRLLDDDLNPTHWISTSAPVNIFNDSVTNNYDQVEGSKNTQLPSQFFQRTSKSIRLTLGHLDQNYPFYQIAVIHGTTVTGKANKALLSQNIAITTDTYIYSGDDANMTEISIPEILLEQISINKPESIEQIENRLELANGTDIPIDFCAFQQFASEIRTEVELKDVILNSVLSEPNSKNAKSSFMYTGYMPGQPVSLGVVYLIDDNSLSPVFHIPGKSKTSTSNMDYYEVEQKYLNLFDCTSGDYWGRDYEGNSLTGKNIRHHKPPTRKNLNLPVYTRTADDEVVHRWKLEVEVTMTSGDMDDYPTGSDGEGGSRDLVLGMIFHYKINGITHTYTTVITKSTVKVRMVIYDGVGEPEIVSGGAYIVMDAASGVLVYDSLFDFHYYGPFEYDATSFLYKDEAKLIGISVSNIKKPHPRVIGFFIVRNEMTDADKVVLDNALIGNTSVYGKYISFGHFVPEVLNSKKDRHSVYFFSPVHQFTGLKPNFTKFDIQGYIEETKKTIGDPLGIGDDMDDAERGVLIEDVMAGTTYDPNLDKRKTKDGDGFDLQIGTVGREFKYVTLAPTDITTKLPPIVNMYYINASFYRSDGINIYYNTSGDNKIGFAIFKDDEDVNLDLFLAQAEDTDDLYPQYPASMHDDDYKYRLLYGAMMVENKNAFANFIDRPYYKEHNNPVMFDNVTNKNITIFNGDAHIGPMTLTSSVFFETQFGDRDKKNKTWQIVAGAVLLAAGVLLSIYGVGIGLTATAVTILANLAVSYGVTVAMSGIKFEQMKSMIDEDYPAGLQETITDAQVERQIRKKREDDTFKWFSGVVANIYMESYINIALRTGVTHGTSDFLPSPRDYTNDGTNSYFTEKFTVIDKDHESGRLYKGYAQAEFYDENPDFRRVNKEKVYFHLPINYDCCDKDGQAFTGRIWYSQQSFQEETIDNFRVFLPNNYRDIEAERGVITDLFKDGNSLYIHTSEGLWKLPTSYQERVTGELTTYIGTGSFFSIPPIPIGTGDLGTGGSKHKWATIKTDNGVFYVSEVEGTVYILNNGQIQPLTENGLSSWFANNLVDNLSRQFNLLTAVVYPNQNNPANPNGVGIHAIYDPRFNRYIITKRDYRIIKDANTLIVVDTEDDVVADKLNFVMETGKFVTYNPITDIISYISLENTDYFENKSWTVSFSLNTKTWVSWHSYLPLFYLNNQDGFYSLINNKIWKHNIIGRFGRFYDEPASHIIEYVASKDGISVCTIESIMIESLARRWDAAINNWFKERNAIFTKLIAYTESQCSGEQIIVPKNSESEFYMSDQVVNQLNSIIASRKETFWSINQLRDFVDDYTQPFLSRKWDDLKAKYFMDKVINPATINYEKDWFEIQSFRDKYVVVRLIFDTFDDVNLLTNYFINTETLSIR